MSFTFNPLWKQLIDKKMTKEELRIAIETSSATIAKMGKDKFVSMEVLNKICGVLDCKIEDVIEYIPENK